MTRDREPSFKSAFSVVAPARQDPDPDPDPERPTEEEQETPRERRARRFKEWSARTHKFCTRAGRWYKRTLPAHVLLGLVSIIVIVQVLDRYRDTSPPMDGRVTSLLEHLLEDPAVTGLLKTQYDIEFGRIQYDPSLLLTTRPPRGNDFLWTSSAFSASLFDAAGFEVQTRAAGISSPVVLVGWHTVVDALVKHGYVTVEDGIYYAEISRLIDLVLAETEWSDLGLPLYGRALIQTPDPHSSGLGATFMTLLASVMNDNKPIRMSDTEALGVKLRDFFRPLGHLSPNDENQMERFLREGAGSVPIMTVYENQIFSQMIRNPQHRKNIERSARVIYLRPTAWASYDIFILVPPARRMIEFANSPDFLFIAHRRYGFRTQLGGGFTNVPELKNIAIPQHLWSVVPEPKLGITAALLHSLRHPDTGRSALKKEFEFDDPTF